jgi:hypothetical protein
MRHRLLIGLILGCLLASGAPAAAAPPEKPRAPGRPSGAPPRFDQTFELEGEEEVARLCAEKLQSGLPLTAIPASDLLLDEIALHTESGYYTVRVPLIHAKGRIERLLWDADTIEEVTTFIRFLQNGKIKLVKVKGFDDAFLPDVKARVPTADLRTCTGEGLTEALAPCRECRVIEWVFGKSAID